jgi:hypothetical protein
MNFKYFRIVILSCIVLCVYCRHSYSQYSFYSGAEWVETGSQDLPAEQKLFIKKLYLQAAQDSSIFSGAPIIPENERDFQSYIPILDGLCSDESNINLPLYFIFKISEMAKNNYPSQQVALYKHAIIQQLEKIGVME